MCLCPGCDARIARGMVDGHVRSRHLGSAVQLLQDAWSQIATLKEELQPVLNLTTALQESAPP